MHDILYINFRLINQQTQFFQLLPGRKQVALDESGSSEGEWHTFRVRVEGNQIVVKLDGRIIVDFVDDSENQRDIGFIGLQQNRGKIEF
ncbi:MAG: DUF1080 domain-containing protein, partial [Proteobacteria bacterium]|nr:DUF1080 domain-containing protein [Pseudomonadota bacterium]